MPAVPPPDPNAATLLKGARSQAFEQLKEEQPDWNPIKAGNHSPPPKGPMPPAPPSAMPTTPRALPSDEQATATQNGPSLTPGDEQPQPPPPPAAANPAGKPGFFQGTGNEIENGVMRGFSELGRAVMFAAAAPAIAYDKFAGGTSAQDAVFKAVDNYANTAVKYWTPSQEETAQHGLGAQVAGGASEVVPALLTGPAAVPLLTAQATTSAGIESVQAGQDAKTAAILATTAGVANALGMKIPLKNPSIWKRIGSSILGNEVITTAQQALTKEILNSSGYKEAADNIDPADPKTILTTLLTAIGFGLHRQTGASPKVADQATQNQTKVGQPPPPPPPGAAPAPPGPSGAEGTPPPPPPTPSAAAPNAQAPAPAQPNASAVAPTEGVGAPGSPRAIPDHPSPESAKDIRAQIVDMNDKTTPRVGVLITGDTQTILAGSKDANAASVNGTVNQAKQQGRTIDVPTGTLILKSKADAAKTQARLAAGEDPQAVVGSVTGASPGTVKTADQTVVVQGQTPSGAVAAETMVAPADVQTAKIKMEDQGKTAVVMTPEDAQARRLDEISKERNTPAQMGIMTAESGKEVAVHVESGAPDGLVRVRPIDADGEPAPHTVDVPSDRVKVTKPTEEAATKVPAAPEAEVGKTLKPASSGASEETPIPTAAKAQEAVGTTSKEVQTPTEDTSRSPSETPTKIEQPKPVAEPVVEKPKAVKLKTALESLPEALEAHESQEQIPEGKKFAAPLAERQDNASAFATVLKESAKSAAGKAAPEDIARATKAAQAAERLTEKGKAATDKGQGTGHTKVTALVAEMHKAARALLGNARPGDEERVSPKEAELKAKIAKKTIAVAKKPVPKEGTNEPKVEVPVGEKYKDQIKSGGGKERALLPPVELKRTAERMLTEYVHADNDEAPAVREKIEQWLHEEMSDEYTPDEQRQVLHMLDAQREDQNPNAPKRTRKMSETVEPEESVLDATDKYEGMSRGGRELLSPQSPLDKIRNTVFKSRLHDEWTKMTTNLLKTGAYTDIVSKNNGTGQHVSSHAILDEMSKHTTTPILKDIIASLRSRAPDVPVYFNDFAKSLRTGTDMETVGGLFHGEEAVAQIATAKDKSTNIDPRIVMQTIVHELTHSATMYELKSNPHGELATSLEASRKILENRMRSLYGDQTIDQHLDYFHGEGKVPETYMRHLYGLKDIHELASEVMANPRFIREIAESEAFASPNERGVTNQPGLLARIYNAIGRFFGIKDPRLLQHIAGLTEAVMEKQATDAEQLGHHLFNRDAARTAVTFEQTMASKFGTNPLEARKAFPTFEALREEPPKLRGIDDELHDEVGPELTRTARAFNWAIKNRGTDAVRTIVTRLKTMDQIFRDHRSDFGDRSDPSNPLNTLEDVQSNKNIVINRMTEISKPVAEKWLKLKEEDSRALGQLMIDTTMYKIDPRKVDTEQPQEAQERSGFASRAAEYRARFEKLDPVAREVYGEAVDANKRLAREFRKAAVDTALHTFTDQEISPAQRSLLYGAKSGEIYDRLIGKDKLIDVGDRNDSLKAALADFAGQSEIEGPYLHLGRQGDYVVSAEPEGSREFTDRTKAQAFADQVSSLSPDSRGKVTERGGKFVVDYKAKYVSMHESKLDAEAAAQRMRDAGYDVGHVTRKTLGKNDTPLGAGARDLVAAAESKINRGGHDEGTKALVDSLRSAFLQIAASRSAYAGSRLARKNFAGVKPEEMRRNFAEHASSTIWHAAQLRTVFDQASALAKVRDMARDSHADVSQRVMYRRGEVVQALNEHMQDEVQNFGHKAPLNSALAKLGFMSYLASPSHALIWMTQNFTTGIPVAGAKWGYGKTAVAFTKGMKVFGPAFRATVHAAISKGGNASDVHEAIIKAVQKDKTLGKWAQGTNSPLQQLIDRGVISHGYSNELGALARGDSALVTRAFEWARLLPNMADAFNRVSTALAGLELSGGDIRQTADFVRQVHADYSQQNKPLLFKKFGRVPGMNSITMFKTYTQSMAHLLYGNLKASMSGDRKAEAAKTVAGMIAANVLFAGVYAGAALEPLRLAMYAYHKLFDEEGEVYDLQNQIHQFLVAHMGKTAGNLAAGGAIPRALGIDLSSRMGLSDLFFHEPPDLLSADKDMWKNFIYNEAGPMASFLAERVTGFVGHMQKGEPFQAVSQLIPIKMYQDAVKAVQLYSTGKTDSLGRQMTQPSGLDAAKQLFGVKPESVALAQEKAGYAINYKGKVNTTKESILKSYVNGDDTAMDRVNNFNLLHPYEAIKSRDLRGIGKVAASEPGESRDQDINEATNF